MLRNAHHSQACALVAWRPTYVVCGRTWGRHTTACPVSSPDPMVDPMVGERRCAAPPLRGGNFSVPLLDRKVKTGRSLFLPLHFEPYVKGIGGYERERDIKGEESGDQKGRFSWERSWRLAGRTLCYPRLCRCKISRNLELSNHSITFLLSFSFWPNIYLLQWTLNWRKLKFIEKISDYKSKFFFSVIYFSNSRLC